MQWLLSTFKQALRKKILVISMLSLSILSSFFVFVQQPSLATPVSIEGRKLAEQEQRSKASQAANKAGETSRELDYDAQVEAAKNPDKVYEENVKEYNEAHPENIVEKTVEGAKQVIEKVTGKE